jgi:hypothetical protein
MKYNRNKLYCFSPPVMIATFIIEIVLAFYTLWRYRRDTITWLAVGLLFCLSLFQLAEYMVCEGSLINGLTWSRIGFVAITMLPPLGLHLIYALGGATRKRLIYPAYLSSVAFILLFLGTTSALSGHECLGNYVIFQVSPGVGAWFSAYYYGWLLAGVAMAWHFVRQSKSPVVRRSLMAMTFGYAAFIIPTATVNIMDPDTIRGIPSIMCGFAVILAIAIVAKVLPGMAKPRKS